MSAHTDLDADTSEPSAVVLVLTTLPVDADAEAFAETFVGERLAACVSIGGPVTSVYRWRGAIERAGERQLLVKTVRGKVPLLKARLAALHPYDVPELIVLQAVDGGEAYFAWVRESAAG
jgi:periplasmic divalent cation tolerance protein